MALTIDHSSQPICPPRQRCPALATLSRPGRQPVATNKLLLIQNVALQQLRGHGVDEDRAKVSNVWLTLRGLSLPYDLVKDLWQTNRLVIYTK
jgi:hypothetical protein